MVYPLLSGTLLQIPFLDRNMVTMAMAMPFVVPPSRFAAVSEL